MLKVAGSTEMQRIDRTTIEKYGIAGIVLMERAGISVVNRINEFFPGNKVVVLCGGGNNGGDGFVIARELHNRGRGVEVYLSAKPSALKGDAKINYQAAKKSGVPIAAIDKFLSSSPARNLHDCLIVDALLGTGLNKDVRGAISRVINKVNRVSLPVISVDIPSGISSDTGRITGCAIKASCTVTFGLPKRGHYLYPGADYTGRLFIEDIGFPKKLLESEKHNVGVVRKDDIISLLPLRPRHSHKGTYGHVLIVGGSRGKTGAALMAAKACLRAGAGLVTIGAPESLVNVFQSRVTEEMVLPLPDKGNGTVSYEAISTILEFIKKKANVIAIGPGLSSDEDITKIVCRLITESKVPLVIDADGINAIAGKTGVLKKGGSPVILTPHPGEMARLLQQDAKYKTRSPGMIRTIIENNRIETAIEFAKKTRACLVLKGAPTVTASPDGNAVLNSTGNPGMATAGTGDVLTGMIAALLARKLTPVNAAVMGVYLHGHAGDLVADKKGEGPLIASDIIKSIPVVFKSIVSRKTC